MDQHDSNRVRHIVGCMTGTSLDGLDAALVKIEGSGLEMKATFLGLVSKSLGPLADQLRHFAEGRTAVPLDYMQAARQLGELHAAAVRELCDAYLTNVKSPGMAIPGLLSFVVAHGQTIWHAPRKSGNEEPSLSWQLFDPWPLVRAMQVPVCYDLRQADLIARGQGAPITPMSDGILYGNVAGSRLVVNLGGICNVTLLDHEPGSGHLLIDAYDQGPCNLLIDRAVRILFPGRTIDHDGILAGRGRPSLGPRATIRENPFFRRTTPRTAGREDFNELWVEHVVQQIRTVFADPHDVLASILYVLAYDITEGVDYASHDMILAGGGTRNRTLVRFIREFSKIPVRISDDLGIPSEAREAMAFAVLGALSHDGVPITLPQVTGADKPGRAGAWVYP